ncbi:MAG: hypothetical protein H6811_06135 [Phycisphaeraceae bacterium]|nr:hypothetical protein [Phycisphaeraceae bacterium]
MIRFVGLCLVSLGAACSSAPQAGEMAPGDFSISVTVTSPEQDAAIIERLPRHVRPARYVLEPDWVLRVGVGPGARPEYFPPRLRRLDQAEVDRIWKLIQASGILRESHPGDIPGEETFRPFSGEPVAVIEVRHDARRDARAIRLSAGDGDADAASAIVDHLADLAWMRP